jgi:hypothetical protein
MLNLPSPDDGQALHAGLHTSTVCKPTNVFGTHPFCFEGFQEFGWPGGAGVVAERDLALFG